MTDRRGARSDRDRIALAAVLASIGTICGSGCSRATQESDSSGRSTGAVNPATAPVLRVDPHALHAADQDGGASAVTARAIAPSIPDGGLARSEPVGGPWVSCYANFRATSTPERDVARLAALCGPPNGMVPAAPIAAGDAVDAAEDYRLEVRAGDCFRIFAVADILVSDLGVEVVNPRGNPVTWDRNGDRWPILNPDGPFCLFDAGTYTVRVRALQGRGRYAMQVWRLPVPP